MFTGWLIQMTMTKGCQWFLNIWSCSIDSRNYLNIRKLFIAWQNYLVRLGCLPECQIPDTSKDNNVPEKIPFYQCTNVLYQYQIHWYIPVLVWYLFIFLYMYRHKKSSPHAASGCWNWRRLMLKISILMNINANFC